MPFSPLLAEAIPPPPDGIYDIVVPQPEASPWPLVLSILAALLVAAGAVLLVMRLLRSRGGKAAPPDPGRRARLALDRAEREHDRLEPNRFALLVSEALKDYFGERFRDPVRFETAEEFLHRLANRETGLPPSARHLLGEFLTGAEELKFGLPGDAASRTRPILKQARDLVAQCESVNAGGGDGAG